MPFNHIAKADRTTAITDQLSNSEEYELVAFEATIERGLQTFVEVGNALAEIREKRLYRAQYGTFEDYLTQRWNMTPQHAGRLISAAEVAGNLEPIGSIPVTESQARPLTSLEPEVQRAAWQEVIDTAPNGKITAAHVEAVAQTYRTPIEEWDVISISPVATALSDRSDYDGNEWYTPSEYIDAARLVLGTIDIDPASCEYAQQTVKAATFYTKSDNGLLYDWPGRVFLNPPYSYPEVEHFTQYLMSQYDQKLTTSAILLVNNCTDAQWFQSLLSRYPVCFTSGRIKFERPDAEVFATRQGQAFFYLGTDVMTFAKAFGEYGVVVGGLL